MAGGARNAAAGRKRQHDPPEPVDAPEPVVVGNPYARAPVKKRAMVSPRKRRRSPTVSKLPPAAVQIVQNVVAGLKRVQSATNVLDRAARLTKLHRSSVARCVSQPTVGEAAPEPAEAEPPVPRFRVTPGVIALTRFFFYALLRDGIWPTVDLVYQRHKEWARQRGFALKLSRATVHRLMRKQLGMSYKRRAAAKRLKDNPVFVRQRQTYIAAIRKARAAGRPLVWVDETWGNVNMAPSHVWFGNDKAMDDMFNINVPTGKGRRIIIVDAGGYLGKGQYGFVPGARLIFPAKKHNKNASPTGDYHESMTKECFKDWFTNLVRQVPRDSVVVVDRAKYHVMRVEGTKIPTKSSTKPVMEAFVKRKKIKVNAPKATRAVLFAHISDWLKDHDAEEQLEIQVIADKAKKGISVVVLPVGHCELNPIEMAWGISKGYVCKNNTDKKKSVDRLQELFGEGLKEVTPRRWERMCAHVVGIEDMYLPQHVQEVQREAFIISLDDESDSDPDESDNEGVNGASGSDSE